MSSKKNFEIAFQLGAKLNPSVKKAFGDASKQLGNMKKNIGNVIKTSAKMAAGLAVAGAAVVGAAGAMANKFAATGDRIDKLSQKIGLSRQAFQEWEFILSQSGTDIEKMQTGLKTLNQRMEEATRGTGKGADAFKTLELSAYDSTGALKTQEQMFEETVVALQEMEDGSEKARLATELLGKAGQELMPLLNGAAGSVDEMKQKAHELGIVVGDDAVDAAILWTDTMDQAKRAMGGLFNTIAAGVLPTMQKFLDMGMSKLPALQKTVKTSMSVAGNVLSWVGEKGMQAFNGIQSAIRDNQPTIERVRQLGYDLGEVLKNAFNNAQPYISWLSNEGIPLARDMIVELINKGLDFYNLVKDNWSTIKPIVIGAAIALGSLKLAMIAMSVTQTVTTLLKGFKAATVAARLSMLGLNAAMLMNPMTWVVAGVIALVAGIYLLVKNFDWVKEKAAQLWQKLLDNPMLALAAGPIGILIAAGISLYKNFDTVKERFGQAWEGMKSVARTSANGIISFINGIIGAFEGMINGAANAVNKMPSVKIPDWVPKYGGNEYGIPNIPTVSMGRIPMLAQGGITTGPTLAMIGEGAEQEAVLPLSKLKSLLNMPGSNDQSLQVVYSPQIVIHGNTDKQTIDQALDQGYNKFKQWMKKFESERNRKKL
ncbi:hypothetical protein ACJ2A9_21275 [Anaerobacillus sp. MEB173]|uniref:hypothetical protein n=1 Tax=Anaerobacillus sp. MEB173 TaxID=3383345 RepID=UPI003F90D6A2